MASIRGLRFAFALIGLAGGLRRRIARAKQAGAAVCYGEFPRLVADEGNDVGVVSTDSPQVCKDACDRDAFCRSFSFCPQWRSCWLKDRALNGSEPTQLLGECRTYYKTSCSSPGPMPTPTPSPAACKVGVGLSLDSQRNPLPLYEAVGKLRQLGVRCVRLWHYRADYLQALLGVGITDVLVNVPTDETPALASGLAKAQAVVSILKPFHAQGMRFRIAVGNEPLRYGNWERYLLPGMQNLHRVLQEEGLADVTTNVAFSYDIIGVSYPPSRGAFKSEFLSTLRSIAEFIHTTGGEFVIQIYPYFGVKYNPEEVPLELALGRRASTIDGTTYNGLLHQQIAAARAALVAMDPKYRTLPMSIGECGWPTQGHWAATTQNAAAFTDHVIRMFPDMDSNLRTLYLFEAFDEQLKSSWGGEDEDHFGIMLENGNLKYNVDLRDRQ